MADLADVLPRRETMFVSHFQEKGFHTIWEAMNADLESALRRLDPTVSPLAEIKRDVCRRQGVSWEALCYLRDFADLLKAEGLDSEYIVEMP